MIEVVAAIIKINTKFLCCQRGKNQYSYLSEKFEFPGGKVENNETLEEALLREIKEELGLKIFIDKFLKTINYSYPDFDIRMHCYICSLDKFEIKLNDHISYKIVAPGKLSSLDWVPADKELINLLQK